MDLQVFPGISVALEIWIQDSHPLPRILISNLDGTTKSSAFRDGIREIGRVEVRFLFRVFVYLAENVRAPAVYLGSWLVQLLMNSHSIDLQ